MTSDTEFPQHHASLVLGTGSKSNYAALSLNARSAEGPPVPLLGYRPDVGHTLLVLQARPFRLLLAARTVSMLGNGIAPIALAFGVLSMPGGGATDLGLVLLARELTQVIFLLLGGVIADRLPRYALMVAADLAAALSQGGVAALFLTHSASLLPLMVLSAINGATIAVFFPAFSGLIPGVVPGDQLQPANAMIRVGTNVANILGAAVAGVLVATVGVGWALLGDALTFLLSAALLAGVRTSRQAKVANASIIGDLVHGWREFVARQWVCVVVCQFAFVNACFTGCFLVLGPIVASRSLGGAPAWAVIITMQSIGLVIGSFLGLRVSPRHPIRVGVFLTFSLIPPFLLIAAAAPAWVIGFFALVAGVCIDLFGIWWYTALQTHVAQDSLSRVSSYDALGSFALGPIELAVVGPIAAAVGIAQTLVGAAVLVAISCALALSSPQVRNLNAVAR